MWSFPNKSVLLDTFQQCAMALTQPKKAIELVDEYNKNTGEKLATFKINEKNQTVIAVLDELAERVHQLVPNAGNQVSSLRAKSVCL